MSNDWGNLGFENGKGFSCWREGIPVGMDLRRGASGTGLERASLTRLLTQTEIFLHSASFYFRMSFV